MYPCFHILATRIDKIDTDSEESNLNQSSRSRDRKRRTKCKARKSTSNTDRSQRKSQSRESILSSKSHSRQRSRSRSRSRSRMHSRSRSRGHHGESRSKGQVDNHKRGYESDSESSSNSTTINLNKQSFAHRYLENQPELMQREEHPQHDLINNKHLHHHHDQTPLHDNNQSKSHCTPRVQSSIPDFNDSCLHPHLQHQHSQNCKFLNQPFPMPNCQDNVVRPSSIPCIDAIRQRGFTYLPHNVDMNSINFPKPSSRSCYVGGHPKIPHKVEGHLTVQSKNDQVTGHEDCEVCQRKRWARSRLLHNPRSNFADALDMSFHNNNEDQSSISVSRSDKVKSRACVHTESNHGNKHNIGCHNNCDARSSISKPTTNMIKPRSKSLCHKERHFQEQQNRCCHIHRKPETPIEVQTQRLQHTRCRSVDRAVTMQCTCKPEISGEKSKRRSISRDRQRSTSRGRQKTNKSDSDRKISKPKQVKYSSSSNMCQSDSYEDRRKCYDVEKGRSSSKHRKNSKFWAWFKCVSVNTCSKYVSVQTDYMPWLFRLILCLWLSYIFHISISLVLYYFFSPSESHIMVVVCCFI